MGQTNCQIQTKIILFVLLFASTKNVNSMAKKTKEVTEKKTFKAFFQLLKSCNIRQEDRAGVLFLVCAKRSLKELNDKEYREVLAYLTKQSESFQKEKTESSIKKMRSTVLRIAQSNLGFDKDGKIDWERFNSWMLNKSKFKKPLKELEFTETRDLVSQMRAISKHTKEKPKPLQV